MSSQELTRTSYKDPNQNNNPRTGFVRDDEALADFEQYQKKLEQIHVSSLHGFGVASGLAVTATLHAQGIQVSPGVALDLDGHHISLAPGGNAKVADPNTPGGSILIPVVPESPAGPAQVTIPTAHLSGGPMYLTIAFDEAFDDGALINSGQKTYQINHTPYLRLVDTIRIVHDGSQVILATVTLGRGVSVGQVTGLSGEARRQTVVSTSELVINRSGADTFGSTLSVNDDGGFAGTLGPLDFGGLLLSTNVLAVKASSHDESFRIDGTTGNAIVAGGLTAASLAVAGDATVGGSITTDEVTGSGRGVRITTGCDIEGGLSITGASAVSGDFQIHGTLTKSAGAFRIDHPQDPANRYLTHSFVESPDMMNVYNGNTTTDDQGEAVVSLPGYFEALNVDYRYQLTVIGQPAQAYISEEIDGGRFSIQTDRPHVKVSWQVTGVRRDPYALANPIRVEQDKLDAEQGLYLHPHLYGEPDDRSLSKSRRPARPPVEPGSTSSSRKFDDPS